MSRRRLTAWLLGFLLAWGATAQPPTDPGVIWDEFPPAGPLAPTDRFLLAQGVQGSQPNPFLTTLSDLITLVVEEVTGDLVVPGLDTQVIFNDGGAYGADAGLTYNKTLDALTILDGWTLAPSLLAAATATGPALLDIDATSSTPTVIPDRSLPTTGVWSGYQFGVTAVGLSVAGNGKLALSEVAGQTSAVITADQVQIGGDDPQVLISDTDGAVTSGEHLYEMEFSGSDDAVSNGTASLRVVASADWAGATSTPSEIVFGTTPVGSTSQIEALTITSAQTLETPNDVLVGGESVCLEDGTNCPTGSGVLDDIFLTKTTFVDPHGVIYKDGTRFLHDFNYGNNGTVTTSGQNTFLGELAGNFTLGATATTAYQASNNTMVGYRAGNGLTIGYNNTGVGRYALNGLTSGVENVAFGALALYQASTGDTNTAIGTAALGSITTGGNNTAVGSSAAGSGNFDGNTVVGTAAFLNLTTGSSNVVMGTEAGRYFTGPTALTSLSNSVLIGQNTKVAANGDSNEIVIGFQAEGHGSNTVTLGNDSITDTYLKGEVHQALDYGTTFPSSPTTGLIFVVTDDSSAGACDSAAGSATSICRWNGSAWAPMGGIGGESITQIFNGKTIHYSNNIVTVTSIIPLTPAACQNTTAYLQWDHETANYPAAACVTGTNTQKAYADFDQTTDECMQASIPLPDDFVPADGVDAYYTWLTTATSGSVAWCSQVICTGNAETDDPAFPAQASGNCVTDAALGTTNQLNNVTDTGITITGCAASEIMHLRLCRDPNETGGQTDTVAADARLANMYLKIRREM